LTLGSSRSDDPKMGVLLNWAATMVVGGAIGAIGASSCPSENENGAPSWPVALRHQLRHDLGIEKSRDRLAPVTRNALMWLASREYQTAFGTRGWACDDEGPPRPEPELMLPQTRALRSERLADCARERKRRTHWEQELDAQIARRRARRDPG
jgi:hypothetical protein